MPITFAPPKKKSKTDDFMFESVSHPMMNDAMTNSNVSITYEYDDKRKMSSSIQYPSLSWRTDENDSLSDWTMNVCNLDDDSLTTYHVHKNFLGAGCRRSGYFDRLFKLPQQMEELTTCTSNISFRGAAIVDAVPEMLDHIYTGHCNFISANTTALRYLANYFLIPTLHAAVDNFIDRDLCPSSAQIYLEEASRFADDTVVERVYTMYAKCLHSLTTEELCCLSPNELLRIIVSRSEACECDSETLSKQIATYFHHHPEVVCRQVLEDLTSEKLMPTVSPLVALPLLKLAIQYTQGVASSLASTVAADANNGGESLQQRCIKACGAWEEALGTASFVKAMHMEDGNSEEEPEVMPNDSGDSDEFLDLPDSVKVDILQLALTSCNRSLKKYKARHSRRLPSLEEDISFNRSRGPRGGPMGPMQLGRPMQPSRSVRFS